MAAERSSYFKEEGEAAVEQNQAPVLDSSEGQVTPVKGWRRFLGESKPVQEKMPDTRESSDGGEEKRPPKWSMGVLNDPETDEVPGSVLLMSKESKRNEPLGLRNAPARTSASSLPSPYPPGLEPYTRPLSKDKALEYLGVEEKKKTPNGQIILDPQPDDSLNDPLNWPAWRRDIALLSLGFYCMMGGGMTPVLAAGFSNVAMSYHVTVPQVALTTGLYMMGLGLGSVIASPTAILFGKRPVYLVASLLFSISSIWCALSPNYISLVIARIVQGIAVSPVECLPSATIAEIFFLHERAYRLGIYTLLLLGGKNLIPLVSAAIIQAKGWQWVFWVVAIIVGFCTFLLFFFVPETFWDRVPHPKHHHKGLKPALAAISAIFSPALSRKSTSQVDVHHGGDAASDMHRLALSNATATLPREVSSGAIAQRRQKKPEHHVGFAEPGQGQQSGTEEAREAPEHHITFADPTVTIPSTFVDGGEETVDHPYVDAFGNPSTTIESGSHLQIPGATSHVDDSNQDPNERPAAFHTDSWKVQPRGEGPRTPALHNLNSPFYVNKESPRIDYVANPNDPEALTTQAPNPVSKPASILSQTVHPTTHSLASGPIGYTHHLRTQPPKTFAQTLRPWNGRLRKDSWLKAAFRPFILFAYPAILWSTLIYSLSIGWLIVISESVADIYRSSATYNFSALQAGLVYISPFIGGVLGTAVAGKISDIIVRYLSRKNGGVYEPEFRLVMAIPVTISTCIGLMGYGWSAAERDAWIVPTVFFGIISFGCSLGSTTAITFAVDSYRQYAGEALVTLNFSKNIFHGLVFSLFFTKWLETDGSKSVFIIIGIIQLVCLTSTIPMYIFGKRARMWTVRKNMMEKF